ncbi:ATP-dependent RNA helicase HrpA [Carpediemonas membranifera]|uniref:ATP-dependent RNA helicase HrpA n=1 Tax=Carpediemonas membranifera TaxID=201153 RepID=A0A8J6B2M5_9EUKA|nr:ATP-dependent RNA helicase HrpA [Carpediemonas membranifera]|eukprot:KAG9397080.1 ATP-dependent RNA helicase HrpA [Carpediemonas membranifera]
MPLDNENLSNMPMPSSLSIHKQNREENALKPPETPDIHAFNSVERRNTAHQRIGSNFFAPIFRLYALKMPPDDEHIDDLDIFPLSTCILEDPPYIRQPSIKFTDKNMTPSLNSRHFSLILEAFPEEREDMFPFLNALFSVAPLSTRERRGKRLFELMSRRHPDPPAFISSKLTLLMLDQYDHRCPAPLFARILLWAAIQLHAAGRLGHAVDDVAFFCAEAVRSSVGHSLFNVVGLLRGFSRFPFAVGDISSAPALFWAKTDFTRLCLAAIEELMDDVTIDLNRSDTHTLCHSISVAASNIARVVCHIQKPSRALPDDVFNLMSDADWVPEERLNARSDLQQALGPDSKLAGRDNVRSLLQLANMGIGTSAVRLMTALRAESDTKTAGPVLMNALRYVDTARALPVALRNNLAPWPDMYRAICHATYTATLAKAILETAGATNTRKWDFHAAPVHLLALRTAVDYPYCRDTVLSCLHALLASVPSRESLLRRSRPHADLSRLRIEFDEDVEAWVSNTTILLCKEGVSEKIHKASMGM